MKIYCTLFDTNYLSRGIACYESLAKCADDFLLYIFAFDDLSYKILQLLSLKNAHIISLQEFEDPELLKVKSTRSKVEYCWTCTPSIINYVIQKYGHDHCTYIDADLYFYRDPSILYSEMKDNSVLITPHFYTAHWDQSNRSGYFCVQYLTFKNDDAGMKVLRDWRSDCLDWCYDRFEEGKFGDQKYLDSWPQKYSKVYVTHNHKDGVAVAPWNIQGWTEAESNKIIFYHFHALRMYNFFAYKGGYEYPIWANHKLYRPYISHLFKIEKSVQEKFPEYRPTTSKLDLNLTMRLLGDALRFKHNFVWLHRS